MTADTWKTKLEMLKEKVQHGRDLYAIAAYFMDEFAESREFIDLSQPGSSDIAEAVALEALKQLLKESKIRLNHLTLLRVRGTDFVHGSFFLEGRLGMILFFEGIQMGVLAFPPDYMRLTAFTVGTGPIDN